MATPSVQSGTVSVLAAELSQAAYFRGVLADRRAVLGAEIAKRTRGLSALSSRSDALAINRLRREIRVNEAEYRDLDRMIEALDRRFGL